MMLVEGSSVTIKGKTTYQYAETFVIPAAAKKCVIKNNGKERAKVIKAFLKEDHFTYGKII